MNRLICLLVLVFSLPISLPSFAFADSSCIRGSKGRQVLWDKSWQEDRRDHGTVYLIESILPETSTSKTTLKLVAVGKATVNNRHAIIANDKAAELFCKRIRRGSLVSKTSSSKPKGSGLRSDPFAKADDMLEQFGIRDVTPEDLAFRKREYNTWMTAKPQSEEKIGLCNVKGLSYSCSEADSLVKEKGRTSFSKMHVLPQKFIRYVSSRGWVLAQPIDIEPSAMFSTCRVLDQEFSCLAKERKAHFGRLQELNSMSGVHQGVSSQLHSQQSADSAK